MFSREKLVEARLKAKKGRQGGSAPTPQKEQEGPSQPKKRAPEPRAEAVGTKKPKLASKEASKQRPTQNLPPPGPTAETSKGKALAKDGLTATPRVYVPKWGVTTRDSAKDKDCATEMLSHFATPRDRLEASRDEDPLGELFAAIAKAAIFGAEIGRQYCQMETSLEKAEKHQKQVDAKLESCEAEKASALDSVTEIRTRNEELQKRFDELRDKLFATETELALAMSQLDKANEEAETARAEVGSAREKAIADFKASEEYQDDLAKWSVQAFAEGVKESFSECKAKMQDLDFSFLGELLANPEELDAPSEGNPRAEGCAPEAEQVQHDTAATLGKDLVEPPVQIPPIETSSLLGAEGSGAKSAAEAEPIDSDTLDIIGD